MTIPTRIKPIKIPRECAERIILAARCAGLPLAAQERQIDEEIAWWEWSEGHRRMWRHIARHATASPTT